jgi:hypothetical protein
MQLQAQDGSAPPNRAVSPVQILCRTGCGIILETLEDLLQYLSGQLTRVILPRERRHS